MSTKLTHNCVVQCTFDPTEQLLRFVFQAPQALAEKLLGKCLMGVQGFP